MEKISYRLQNFEGPLDLLLHLIEVNKVDIYDIPIAQITDQYLEYIGRMEIHDMETASDFLVMASELLRIKSKMLLPAQKSEEEEESGDPREELTRRLIEYKMYKYLARILKGQGLAAGRCCYKETTMPPDITYSPEPVDLEQLVGGLDISRLQEIFSQVMQRSADRIDPVRSRFGKIEEEPVDFAERSRQIRKLVRTKKKDLSFRRLLDSGSSKEEVIVTFLVVLEMMKDGTVHTRQDRIFDDILIEVTA